MCARNMLGCLFATMVVVVGLSGCGDDAPVVSTEERTDFIPVDKAIKNLSRAKGYQREEAIGNLERAWKAGELQKKSADELQSLRLLLANMAKGDPESGVKRKAKDLLALMSSGGAATAEQPPAEG